MKKPFTGTAVSFSQYFKGNFGNHPQVFWVDDLRVGMSFNIIASGKTSPAIAYGLDKEQL
jgi:hypothetical protein